MDIIEFIGRLIIAFITYYILIFYIERKYSIVKKTTKILVSKTNKVTIFFLLVVIMIMTVIGLVTSEFFINLIIGYKILIEGMLIGIFTALTTIFIKSVR